MERKKHKRLNDTIMKPEDLKKSRIQKGGGLAGPSTSSASGGGIKAKLDFRSSATNLSKPNIHISSTAGPSVQSSHIVRPFLDEKWQEFGDSVNLNVDSFAKSIKESVELDKFNKVARMLVAALKSFLVEDKLKVEFRLLGTIAETIKSHGAKLNHVHLHRGLLYMISNSRAFPENILQLFVSMTTCLAKQQPMLDKCYLAAYLHDAIGMNVGLGTANRCAWIEKPFSRELVKMIMSPFATVFPVPEMYTASQVEGLVMSEYLPKERYSDKEQPEQLSIYLEFLKPWFDNIRGEVLPKPLFRALCLLCGFDHVRFFIASRLDVWITLQKFHREISELLLVLGCNIDANNDLDKDVIDIMLKLNTKNMKTRTIAGPFSVALRRACELPVNVHAIFESLIINETGPAQNRSPANLPTMYMLLTCQTVEATTALALVCAKELMRDKETCTKMLRGFLRELIRGFNHTKSGEFPFSVFASSFLNSVLKRGIVDEVPRLAVDLVTQIPLATISSLMVTREHAFSSKYSNPSGAGDFIMLPPEARISRDKFQAEFIAYCESVLDWLAKARRVIPDENSIIKCYSLLLYLEKQREAYTGMEVAAISDGELPNVMRIFGECGISERMILLLLGGSIPPKNLVEFTASLTQRAAQHHQKFLGSPLVQFSDSFHLVDRLLSVSILPDTEVPRYEDLPALCSKNLFWASWSSIILWMAGGELSDHFEKMYESSPILRYLVFCIMTKRFDFPLDFEGQSAETMKANEDSAMATQKVIVGKYEKKMMRPSNSLNVYMFPGRTTFRAPQSLDDVRIFAGKFKLASRFTKCTSPPLLSRLVASVGAENALYAVREMLAADSTACSMLSSECVFHALMYYFDNQRVRDTDQSTNTIMKALIRQAEANLKSTESVENDYLLSSFISSLASHSNATRSAAVNVFSSLFPSSEDKAFDLVKLAKMPRFEANRLRYMETLAAAILVESDNRLANSYLQFLTENNLMEKGENHVLARAVCHILSTDCTPLHSSLCQFYLKYLDLCIQQHSLENLKLVDETLCCMEFGNNRVALAKEVPIAIIKLLSKYATESEGKDEAFEALVELWLSPGAMPKLIDIVSGSSGQFLSLAMRKEMLKSTEQRVVDAALDELSEQDAQEFVLVSQMSSETAEKVIRKAENMTLVGVDNKSLFNMYLIIRGYRIKGINAGENLEKRLKEEVDKDPTKDEPMEVTEEVQNSIPISFLLDTKSTLETLENTKMATSDISAWLKVNCAAGPAAKQKQSEQFQLPPSFIRSAMSEEKSALACLQHIEANLKYFLSHESAFQTLIVIIDSAANKFSFVQKRLENLAVRLLKSVSPPVSVSGVLQKHATHAAKPTTQSSNRVTRVATFAELAVAIKGSSSREKRLIDEFMASFVRDKGELIEWADVNVFIRSLRSVYSGGNAETTAERCLSNRWTSDLQRTVCHSLFERHREHVCPVFVFRLLSAYCKKFPLESYNELFLTRNRKNQIVANKKAFQSLSVYFSEVSNNNQEYDMRILNLIVSIEKQGKVPAGLEFGTAFIQTSCANPRQSIRIASKRLLDSLSERLTYLSYKAGIASSIRVLTNVESRESCIRRCEQIVDRLVEMPMDPRLALSEDICEEERPTKNEEPKRDTKRPVDPRERSGSHSRGAPPVKKGRFISAKDLPVVGGTPPPVPEEPVAPEEPVKREWIATSQAMTRFLSLLREHPNIVKMKFPVLANFVSRLTALTRKELRDENRIRKVELILQAVVSLCPFLHSDELSSVETALSNCFEFYEKHLEDGSFGIKEQSAFADLIVQACAAYLNRSFSEARTFLRDNRQVAERVGKRSRDPRAEVVLDNCDPS